MQLNFLAKIQRVQIFQNTVGGKFWEFGVSKGNKRNGNNSIPKSEYSHSQKCFH